MNNTPSKEVKRMMRGVREKNKVPSSEQVIVAKAFEKLGFTKEKIKPNEVLVNFNSMLRRLWEETLTAPESHEKHIHSTDILDQFVHDYPDDVAEGEIIARDKGFAAGVTYLLRTRNQELRRAFRSPGYSRITRGGRDLELQISGLFDLAEIPYDIQKTTDCTNFILPNSIFHEHNRPASAIVSVKRTRRGHWTEVANDLFDLRTPSVFLFTADEDITSAHVKTICEKYKIHLVVWDDLKTNRFRDDPLVLGFTEWASQRLVILRLLWV